MNAAGEEGRHLLCGFLVNLLKVANILSTSKAELVRRVGWQLEEASVADLLIPSLSYNQFKCNQTCYNQLFHSTLMSNQRKTNNTLQSASATYKKILT